jgi:GT2 family glycosyltransferase
VAGPEFEAVADEVARPRPSDDVGARQAADITLAHVTVAPRVRVVVLNYDGGEMTLRCLDGLRRLDYPHDRLDVVLVDNGSIDGIVDRVRAEYPEVIVKEPLANLGFAGGCNLGIGDPAVGDYDYVALLNNDAVAEPGWLTPLVDTLESDTGVGAASSKILFASPYWGTRIDVAVTFDRGARLSGLEVDGHDVWDTAFFDEGFWGPSPSPSEVGARWTKRRAEVRIAPEAAGDGPKRMALRLSADAPRTATLATGGEVRHVTLERQPAWFELDLPSVPHDVINNVGSNLFAGGFGGDRGYLERDEGQYDEPCDVFAWCGGSVLLRPDYLRAVGSFDERFFLYYEDTDLSWRGQLLGWRHRYVPASVVRHEHAASSGEGSDLFRYFVERNRLLMLVKNAPARLATRAALIEARSTVRAVTAEFLRPMARGQRPRPNVAPQKVRSTRSFVKHLPAMVAERRRLERRRAVTDAEILAWMVTK